MSRNGSGTMSVINSFSANTTIESAKVNQNFTDIASELTGSLPRDGQAAMTGQLKAASGSVTAPAMTFSSDLDTGWYYIGGNNFGAACNGAQVLDIATTGFTVTGTLTASGAITGSSTLSIGTSNAATVGSIELGHASDTTIARSGAGAITVEGVGVALNSTSVTHTAGTIELGAASDTTLARVSAGVISVEGSTVFTEATGAATQANQETGTSTATYVSPGRQQYHKSAAKMWCRSNVSGGTPADTLSYNVASLSDAGTGRLGINLTTAFSTASVAAAVTPGLATTSQEQWAALHTGNTTASYIEVFHHNASTSAADPDAWNVICFGDQ